MPKSSKKSPPPSEEWNFEGIEEWELFPATTYEYLRSHPILRPALEDWLNSNFGQQWESQTQFDVEFMGTLRNWRDFSVREALRTAQGGPLALRSTRNGPAPCLIDGIPGDEPILGEFESTIIRTFRKQVHPLLRMVAIRLIDFPTPWISLKPKPDRRLWDDFRPRPAVVRIDGYSHGARHHAPSKPIQKPEKQQPSRYVFEVLVDRNQGKNAIAQAFGELVAPYLITEPENPTGAGRSRRLQLLKWLAAYRLRDAGLSFARARAHLDSGSRKPPAPFVGADIVPIYNSPQSWSTAIGKARAILSGDPEFCLNEIVETFC